MDRLNAAISGALGRGVGLDALACVDLRTGAVLSSATRGERSREALEVAAQVASQLCDAPPPELATCAGSPVRATFVVSDQAVHVFVPSTRHPRTAWVGVAPGSASLALVISMLRGLAGTADGEEAP